MQSKRDLEEKIVGGIARKSGVAEEDVRRVLDALDLSGCIKNMAKTLTPETIEKLGAGNVKVRVRSGQTMVHA